MIYKIYFQFNFRPIFTKRNILPNFKNLQKHINENSSEFNSESYVKKDLGVEWNISKVDIIFTFSGIIETAESLL